MRRRSRWIAALAGLALSGVAVLGLAERSEAAIVAWDLRSNAPAAQSGCAAPNPVDCGVQDGTDGNVRTFTNGTSILKATAFSTSDDAGTSTFVKSWLGIYSGGLGVTNPSESSASPNHTVDNAGKKDMVVFEFPTAGWIPLSLFLSQFGDTDITAWVGGNASLTSLSDPDWLTLKYSTLTANGFTQYTAPGASLTGGSSDRQADLNNDPAGSAVALNLTGKYLIIAAALTGDATADYFKIKTLTGETPSTSVPEPVTSALLGAGLLALGFLKRRSS